MRPFGTTVQCVLLQNHGVLLWLLNLPIIASSDDLLLLFFQELGMQKQLGFRGSLLTSQPDCDTSQKAKGSLEKMSPSSLESDGTEFSYSGILAS